MGVKDIVQTTIQIYATEMAEGLYFIHTNSETDQFGPTSNI